MSYFHNILHNIRGWLTASSWGKYRIAKLAKAQNLDAIHDTVHEMARDEARHGQGFQGTSVFINACESGNNKSGNSGQYMVENFANMTNSTVIASTSEIEAGYKYDGSIVKTTDPNGQFIVSHGNFKSSSATNVRIHSALGISWAEENTSKDFDVSPLVQPTFMTP